MEAYDTTYTQVTRHYKKNTCFFFPKCEVGKMEETESNISKETKYTTMIDSLSLNAWDTVPRGKELYTVQLKMVKWQRRKRSTAIDNRSKHKLPLAFTLTTTGCIVSQVQVLLLLTTKRKQHAESQWSDPMLHLVLKIWPVHCLNHLALLWYRL